MTANCTSTHHLIGQRRRHDRHEVHEPHSKLLKRGYIGDYIYVTTRRLIKRNTRSLDTEVHGDTKTTTKEPRLHAQTAATPLDLSGGYYV